MPQFVPGKLHFKNKFCDNCRHSVVVPASRVCALTAELAACFVNKRSEGFWNRAPASMGGGQYRIINNTAGSVGPRLALFRDQPPPQFYWPAPPEHWVTDGSHVRLCVAKGTLVPAKTLRCGHPQACHPRQARRRISQQLGLSAETIPHISHISPIASITSDYFRSLLGAQGGEQQDQSILGELQGGLAADLGSISTDEISTSVDELALFNEVAGLSSLRPSVASRSSSMSLNADLLTAASDGPKARAKPEQGVDLEADLEADLDHDLTSMIEGWKASQAAGGGTADDSLDVSRASTVCRGLQGMGLGGERSELGLDDSTLGLLNANQASPDRASPDLSRSSSVGTIVASQSHGRIAAPATDDASEAPECASCWGAQINGGATCMPQFVPGKLHFKNKFCDNCRHSVVVPASRVCALTAELAACFVNKRSEGFWNRAPASMGGGQYRIINNTAGSVGPRLALFRDQPPPQFYWPTLPEQWVTNGSYVRLCVAKGTLVPAKALRPYHPQVCPTTKRPSSRVDLWRNQARG